MSRVILFFVILGLTGCFLKEKDSYDEVMKVIHKYSKDLKEEGIVNRWYGLHYAGPDKVYDGKIHEISLGYSIDNNLKPQDARKMFYRIVDGLLAEINDHENLRECFFHNPVTYADLHFSLNFDYESKGHLKQGEVDQIAIEFNKIFYFIANVNGAIDNWIYAPDGPGIGRIHSTGYDALRSIVHKLPETEKDLNDF
jgi:hypothetical protein